MIEPRRVFRVDLCLGNDTTQQDCEDAIDTQVVFALVESENDERAVGVEILVR